MPATKERKPKTDHGKFSALSPIELVPITEIWPAVINDKIYKPIDPNDASIASMAENIRLRGLLEPLVTTLDNPRVLVSGHRRFAACKLAGLTEVPCRRCPVHAADPDFPVIIRDFNRHRVKSLDEVIREEVLSANPEEAHRRLTEHRLKVSQIDVDAIEIAGRKTRAKISEARMPFLDAIIKVLTDRRRFWPLTDRTVHYLLLNDPPLIHASKPESTYQNLFKCYKATCDLIARARLAGKIPWAAIHDPTRPMVTWKVHREPTPFISGQVNDFLKGYYRNLMQSQPCWVEIVGEKNTIDSVIRPVAMEFTIPYTIGRGYSSLSPRHEIAKRFRLSGKDRLVLLMLSDFDPEGEDIPHSFARSMRDDFGVKNITPIKVALTAEQVKEMDLPPQMKAKEGSSRHDSFVAKHGDDVFELESVEPSKLQELLTEAIESVIDIDLFNREVDLEKQDAAKLDAIRTGVMKSLSGILDV